MNQPPEIKVTSVSASAVNALYDLVRELAAVGKTDGALRWAEGGPQFHR